MGPDAERTLQRWFRRVLAAVPWPVVLLFRLDGWETFMVMAFNWVLNFLINLFLFVAIASGIAHGGGASRDSAPDQSPSKSKSAGQEIVWSDDDVQEVGGLVEYDPASRDELVIVGISFGGIPITDGDLAHMKDFPRFLRLDLASTPITDAGLKNLAACKQLQVLNLTGTRVTAVGTNELGVYVLNIGIKDVILAPKVRDLLMKEAEAKRVAMTTRIGAREEVAALRDLPTPPAWQPTEHPQRHDPDRIAFLPRTRACGHVGDGIGHWHRGNCEMAWAMLMSSPAVRELSVDEVRGRSSDAVVVDVRESEELVSGHVPGAISLPQADLATRLDEVPRDLPVVLICQGGFRSLRAAQFLIQRGFTDVASVKGGTEAWRAAGAN
jgi:rhodanese-related sulfurtransferase